MSKKQITFIVILSSMIVLQVFLVGVIYFFRTYNRDIYRINVLDYCPDSNIDQLIYTGNLGDIDLYREVKIRTQDNEYIEEGYLRQVQYGEIIGEFDSEVKMVVVDNKLMDKEEGLVELTNKPKWKYYQSQKRIKDINKTVVTKAGTFEKCIEISITFDDSDVEVREYYAPKVGFIYKESYRNGNPIIFNGKSGDKWELERIILKNEDNSSKIEDDNLDNTSIFSANVKDNKGKIFKVNILPKDEKYEIINSPSYLAKEGDTVLTGKLDISISANNKSKTYSINSENNDDVFILNTSVENIRVLESLNEETPDIIMISQQMSTNVFRIQCFFIKDGELKKIMFKYYNEDIRTSIYSKTFFSIVGDNRFEHQIYDVATGWSSDTYFFDIENNIFIRELGIKNVEADKVIITMEEAVEIADNINDTDLEFVCYENMKPGELLDGYPTEYYYIVLGTLDGQIHLAGCYYVNMYTGEIYFNGPSGSIYRVSDNTYVGTYGQLPKVNQ